MWVGQADQFLSLIAILFSYFFSHGVSRAAPLNPFNYLSHWFSGKGPLTDAGLGPIAFINTQPEYRETPDLQIHSFTTNFNVDFGTLVKSVMNINDEYYEAVYKPMEDK